MIKWAVRAHTHLDGRWASSGIKPKYARPSTLCIHTIRFLFIISQQKGDSVSCSHGISNLSFLPSITQRKKKKCSLTQSLNVIQRIHASWSVVMYLDAGAAACYLFPNFIKRRCILSIAKNYGILINRKYHVTS